MKSRSSVEAQELSSPGGKWRSERTRLSFSSEGVSRARLDRVPLFEACSESFIEALSHQLQLEVFTAGTKIIKQGEQGASMFLLNFGEVDVLIGEEDTCVAQLYSGALFGEMAAISKNPASQKRTATIRAKTVCHCWRIDRAALNKILPRYPKDEQVLSAEADKRMQDLLKKGLHPGVKLERSWSIAKAFIKEAQPAQEDPLKRSLWKNLRNKVQRGRVNSQLPLPNQISSSMSPPPQEDPMALNSVAEDDEIEDESDAFGNSGGISLPSVTELPSRPHTAAVDGYPHSRMHAVQDSLAKWAIGETSELKHARQSAREFLAKREDAPIAHRRFTRRRYKQQLKHVRSL